MQQFLHFRFSLLALVIMLGACQFVPGNEQATPSARPTATVQPPRATPLPTATLESTPLPTSTATPVPPTNTPLPPTLTPTSTLFAAEPLSPDNLSQLAEMKRMPILSAPVISWVESERVAVGTNLGISIFDTTSTRELRFIRLNGPFNSNPGAFSADGSLFAFEGELWDVQTGERLPLTYEGRNPEFSADGQQLATIVENGPQSMNPAEDLYIQALDGDGDGRTFDGAWNEIFDFALLPGSDGIVTVGASARIWELSSGEQLEAYGARGSIYAIQASQDGRYLIGLGGRGRILIWDLAEGSLEYNLKPLLMSSPQTLAVSPDSKTLAVGGFEGDIWLIDLGTGEVQASVMDNVSQVSSIAFSPDSDYLATIGFDKVVNILSAADGEIVNTFRGVESDFHSGDVVSIALSQDGALLASASRDHSIKLWDMASDQLLGTFSVGQPVIEIVISPDNALLAAGTRNDVYVWKITTGELLFEWSHPTLNARNLDFSPDSKYMVMNNESVALIVDTETWNEVRRVQSYQQATPLEGALFIPNSSMLAVSDTFRTVRLLDTRSWGVIRHITTPPDTGTIYGMWASPDGKYLALGVANLQWTQFNTVIYDVAYGQLLAEIPSTVNAPINYVAFSPDSQLAFIYDGPRAFAIYNTQWEILTKLGNASSELFFTPNGHYLMTLRDGTVVMLGAP